MYLFRSHHWYVIYIWTQQMTQRKSPNIVEQVDCSWERIKHAAIKQFQAADVHRINNGIKTTLATFSLMHIFLVSCQVLRDSFDTVRSIMSN